jgi:hypothetical protein
MALPVPSFHQLKDPIIGKDGKPTTSFKKVLQEWQTKLNQTITLLGEINSKIPIQGRTEGIGTTVQHVDAAGNLASLANVNNTNTDLLTDGTGTPLTGGKRGAIALDTNSRLVDSFRNVPMDVSNTPTSATTLSNNGISTAIPIAASINQFSPATVSYNSGSVDPGVFGGPNFVVTSDPTFVGGAVTYTSSTSPQTQTDDKGHVLFGSITTVNGAAKTGGGNTGGTGGKAGGRGYVQS